MTLTKNRPALSAEREPNIEKTVAVKQRLKSDSEAVPSACHLSIPGFLLGLLFYPEDGGDAFLRNVDGTLLNYTALEPRRSTVYWKESPVTSTSHNPMGLHGLLQG
jgi:hypothetical protein